MSAEPYSDLNRFTVLRNKSVLSSTTGNAATVRTVVLKLQ